VSKLFSILIPVRDDLHNLRLCLASLASIDLTDCEVLVCDDGSATKIQLSELRQILPHVVLHRRAPNGPAAGRNYLAKQARGRFLFFLDADVQASSDTLATARRIIAEQPDLKAFFGSYDDSPADPGLVSNYKNLSHHYLHQQAGGQVLSFWCGCGVIDRELYCNNDGLLECFTRPSVEDIELGLRLSAAGTRVYCFPELQVRHLKRWTLTKWIQTDLFRRGIPWVRIMARTGRWQSQLNFTWSQRIATLAAGLLPLSLASAVWKPHWLAISFVSLCLFLWIHAGLWRLLARRQGPARTLLMIPLHLTYSYICILSVVIGSATGVLHRFRPPLAEPAAEEKAG
jgi:glycosyltransferase involved in cell wall biosynthesis